MPLVGGPLKDSGRELAPGIIFCKKRKQREVIVSDRDDIYAKKTVLDERGEVQNQKEKSECLEGGRPAKGIPEFISLKQGKEGVLLTVEGKKRP